MSVSHRYRNFGGGQSPKDTPESTEASSLEDEKLQAFEAGYQAGWDDAIKAKSDAQEKVKEELQQNLLDLSFTYQEALSTMTTSIKPALEQIVEKLLPKIVEGALTAHIVEQVTMQVAENIPQKVEIVVSSDSQPAVEDLIGQALPPPFELTGSDTVTSGQAFIRIDSDEREINLDDTIKQVSEAISAFFHEVEKEKSGE